MSEETVDEALAVLMAPRGTGPGARAAQDAALDILRLEPRIAHPKLLALAEGVHPPPLTLFALAALGLPESVPTLTRALRDGDAPTVVAAAEALARHPAAAAGKALENALLDASLQVVLAAAAALAWRGDARAVPALRAALAAWSDEEAHRRIGEAIAQLAPADASH